MTISKTSIYAATLSAAILLAGTGSAFATSVTLGMTNGVYNVETGATASGGGGPVGYQSSPYFSGTTPVGVANGQGFGQVLQNGVTNNPYLTDAIVVNRVNATTMTITMQTLFSGNDSDTPVHYADLFITSPTASNPNAPNTNWTYAIGLGGQIAGAAAGSGGQGLNGGAAAGVYKLAGNTAGNNYSLDQKTSDQVWSSTGGFYIGGDVATTAAVNSAIANDTAVAGEFAPPTQINTSASGVQDLSSIVVSSVTQTNQGNGNGINQNVSGGDYYDVTVTLTDAGSVTGADLNALFTNFDILWGTGDCSNDAIWGSVQDLGVPAPGALALLGFGLVGLIGISRRRRFQ